MIYIFLCKTRRQFCFPAARFARYPAAWGSRESSCEVCEAEAKGGWWMNTVGLIAVGIVVKSGIILDELWDFHSGWYEESQSLDQLWIDSGE